MGISRMARVNWEWRTHDQTGGDRYWWNIASEWRKGSTGSSFCSDRQTFEKRNIICGSERQTVQQSEKSVCSEGGRDDVSVRKRCDSLSKGSDFKETADAAQPSRSACKADSCQWRYGSSDFRSQYQLSDAKAWRLYLSYSVFFGKSCRNCSQPGRN